MTFTVKAFTEEKPAPALALEGAAGVERLVARTRLEEARARFLGRSASRATARTYAADLRHFFRWRNVHAEDGVPTLDEVLLVRWDDVRRYRDRFYVPSPGTGRAILAASTGARRLAVLRAFFEALRQAGVVREDPTRGVLRPRPPAEGRTRGLSADEVNRILAACPRGALRADRDRLFLGFLFFQWLRLNEAVRLRVEDLSVEQGTPVVRVRQKGGRERTLALRAELATLAQEYVARHGLEGFLFPSLGRGLGERPLSADGARRLVWRPAVLRAGLDPRGLVPHSARVAGITAALLLDVSLPDVQDFAGHARPETTLRYHRARRRLDRAPVGVLPFKLA